MAMNFEIKPVPAKGRHPDFKFQAWVSGSSVVVSSGGGGGGGGTPGESWLEEYFALDVGNQVLSTTIALHTPSLSTAANIFYIRRNSQGPIFPDMLFGVYVEDIHFFMGTNHSGTMVAGSPISPKIVAFRTENPTQLGMAYWDNGLFNTTPFAYTDLARKSQNETITGNWVFQNITTFQKGMKGFSAHIVSGNSSFVIARFPFVANQLQVFTILVNYSDELLGTGSSKIDVTYLNSKGHQCTVNVHTSGSVFSSIDISIVGSNIEIGAIPPNEFTGSFPTRVHILVYGDVPANISFPVNELFTVQGSWAGNGKRLRQTFDASLRLQGGITNLHTYTWNFPSVNVEELIRGAYNINGGLYITEPLRVSSPAYMLVNNPEIVAVFGRSYYEYGVNGPTAISIHGSNGYGASLLFGSTMHPNYNYRFNVSAAGQFDLDYRGTNRFSINNMGQMNYNGNIVVSEDLFAANVIAFETMGSYMFTSGILGAGSRWDVMVGGLTFFEVDNLRVRNELRAHIFKKDIVKASNGYLFITDAAEIAETVTIINTNSRFKVVEDGTNATFDPGQLLWAKNILDNGSLQITGVRITVGTIHATGTTNNKQWTEYNILNVQHGGVLNAGDTIVRVSGGSLLLDASSEYSPFMDVYDGVATWNDFQHPSKLKVRMGKLGGITDPLYGVLQGYGLYSNNVYLTGGINAQFGRIGGWVITSNYLYSGGAYHPEHPSFFGSFIFCDPIEQDTFFHVGAASNSNVQMFFRNTFPYVWGIRGRLNGVTIFELGSSNRIANWNFNNSFLYAGIGDPSTLGFSGVYLQSDPSNSFYTLFAGDSPGADGVYIYYNTANNWGIIGRVGTNDIFRLGSLNRIAGWTFTNLALTSGNIEIHSSGRIRHLNDFWRFNNDGTGRLANGNISWDAQGGGQMAGNKIYWDAAGNMTILGSLITQHITANYINGMTLTFNQGTIGGWAIDPNNLVSMNERITLRGSTGVIDLLWRNSVDNGAILFSRMNGINRPIGVLKATDTPSTNGIELRCYPLSAPFPSWRPEMSYIEVLDYSYDTTDLRFVHMNASSSELGRKTATLSSGEAPTAFQVAQYSVISVASVTFNLPSPNSSKSSTSYFMDGKTIIIVARNFGVTVNGQQLDPLRAAMYVWVTNQWHRLFHLVN
mgnify:CR=1 FL=1